MSETEPGEQGTEPTADVQRDIEHDTRHWADVFETGCAECAFTGDEAVKAVHVRDILDLFREHTQLIVSQSAPTLPSFDGDAWPSHPIIAIRRPPRWPSA